MFCSPTVGLEVCIGETSFGRHFSALLSASGVSDLFSAGSWRFVDIATCVQDTFFACQQERYNGRM